MALLRRCVEGRIAARDRFSDIRAERDGVLALLELAARRACEKSWLPRRVEGSSERSAEGRRHHRRRAVIADDDSVDELRAAPFHAQAAAHAAAGVRHQAPAAPLCAHPLRGARPRQAHGRVPRAQRGAR